MVDVNGDFVWMPGASGVDVIGPASLAGLNVYPNPFNPRTTISFDLASGGPVRVSIHDVRGLLIARLEEGNLATGHHELAWDGFDRSGRPAPAGTYLLRVETGTVTETRRLALIK
jgi:hypothetical protein